MPSERIRCEVNVEFRGQEWLARLAEEWLVGAARALAGAEFEQVLDTQGLAPDAMRRNIPCGRPGSLWGFGTVRRKGSRGPLNWSRVLARESLNKLPGQLAKEFLAAELGISVLGENGYPQDQVIRMSVIRPEEDAGWVQLAVTVPAGSFPQTSEQQTWVRFLTAFCRCLNASFGIISYEHNGGLQTELESRLPAPTLFDYEAMPLSRQRLRGYDWVTLVPGELVAKLGGVAQLKAAGLTAVVELPAGGALVQACPAFSDFAGDVVERLWDAPRPVLPPGMPRRWSDSDEARTPPTRLWYADAA
jgi:hypothetical protein